MSTTSVQRGDNLVRARKEQSLRATTSSSMADSSNSTSRGCFTNRYRMLYLDDGSLSAVGYFDGLDVKQATRSLELLQEEYQMYLKTIPTPPARSPVMTTESESREPVDRGSQDADSVLADDEALEVRESQSNSGSSNDQKRLLEYKAKWGKRNWSDMFHMFQSYKGRTKLSFSVWNRLLEWVWLTLSDKRMCETQGILHRLRTNSRGTPTSVFITSAGLNRSPAQEGLIHSYHKVIRYASTQDTSIIVQRFALAMLYDSHCKYVVQFRTKVHSWQEARQRVNELLYNVFNNELDTMVSQQTITNHVKEGRHWYQLIHGSATKEFGRGLILFLPIQGYTDIVRKTTDGVWEFLLKLLPRMSKRIIELATALQPIAKEIETNGLGHVVAPLLGYELRTPENLHNLSSAAFKKCLVPYPDLAIKDALEVIRIHGRPEDAAAVIKQVAENQQEEEESDSESEVSTQESRGNGAMDSMTVENGTIAREEDKMDDERTSSVTGIEKGQTRIPVLPAVNSNRRSEPSKSIARELIAEVWEHQPNEYPEYVRLPASAPYRLLGQIHTGSWPYGNSRKGERKSRSRVIRPITSAQQSMRPPSIIDDTIPVSKNVDVREDENWEVNTILQEWEELIEEDVVMENIERSDKEN
ncbi:hypothetical protein HOY82DRAFT_619707 [Tuber indicum]|nr:hypothetical protein HOY82DRAFT_619707 [Tuber indicum]